MRLNMKKIWFVSCMAGMLIVPVIAKADSVDININDNGNRGYRERHRDAVEDDENRRITWGIGLGGAALGNGFGSAYSSGYGLDGNVGIKLNHDFAFLLAIDSYIFNTNVSGNYNGEVNIMPTIRLTLPSKDVRPYILVGGGLNDNIQYYQNFFGTGTASATSPVVAGGIGIDFRLDRKLDFYIQGKYEDVLASGGSFSYFPIAAGIQFN
ncbi:MAG TPA: hypothetical protein VK791_05125 [bacterium]|jgi:hypothetical protein|nr:hypothetical protein [bacterium]